MGPSPHPDLPVSHKDGKDPGIHTGKILGIPGILYTIKANVIYGILVAAKVIPRIPSVPPTGALEDA